MNKFLVALIFGLALSFCSATPFHNMHQMHHIQRVDSDANELDQALDDQDEEAIANEIAALSEELGVDPNDPQQDIGSFFSGFLGTLFQGVCAPICQGYKGCRLSALTNPQQFNAQACELHLLKMPCNCKFGVSWRPGSNKFDLSGVPVGSRIPINYGGMGDMGSPFGRRGYHNDHRYDGNNLAFRY